MTEYANVSLIRRFYEPFRTQDYVAEVRAFLRDDVVWHVAGENPLAGDFHGPEAVLGAMRAYGEHSKQTLHLETRSIFGDDDHAVALHRATGKRDRIDYRAHEIDVFHLSGGRIAEFWSFSEDQQATDLFWS